MYPMDGELELLDGIIEGEVILDTPPLIGELVADLTHPVLSGDVIIPPYIYNNNVLYNTTAGWDSDPTFIGDAGVIYIYSDYSDSGVPGIKVGDGVTYLIDLPFITDDILNGLVDHVENDDIHITAQERALWNKRTYVYEQARASDIWTIEHNLDKCPSVTVIDSAGTVVVGDVQYVSNSVIIITFNGAFSGTAYLN